MEYSGFCYNLFNLLISIGDGLSKTAVLVDQNELLNIAETAH